MNYKKVFEYSKNYLEMFYAHCYNELNRMQLMNVDLDNYSTTKPYKIYKDSYIVAKLDASLNASHRVVFLYNTLLDSLKEDVEERGQVYQFIEGIGNLLLFSEKYFLYPNDDNKEMWAVKHNDDLISIYFDFNDSLIECKFQKSAINIKNNSLEEFLDDSVLDYEIFVEINIVRHFGNEFVSNFKSILGSNEFNLTQDEVWLMDLIESKMRKIMLKTLRQIQEHILTNCLDCINLTVEDFENGVELWRSR